MDSLTQKNESIGSSRLIWIVMILGALAIAGTVAWLTLSRPPIAANEPKLENAIREGDKDFDYYKQRIALEPNTDFSQDMQSISGGLSMKLVCVLRNFTGKTITGLQVVGSVVDKNGNVVKEKNAIVIPTNLIQTLDNNKSTPITIFIDGFEKSDDRANIKFRLSAVRVE
jgi:hypothetical protein